MKRSKIMPSILMLIVCIAVLGIGIYAATPTTHSVMGTINITAAGSFVELTAYVGEDRTVASDSVLTRNNGVLEIYDDAIKFECEEVYSASQLDPILLTIGINNKSGKDLGAYIVDEPLEVGAETALKNIKLGQEMLSGTMNGNPIADVIGAYCPGYIKVPKGTETYMEIPLTLLKLDDHAISVNLNFGLNIEELDSEFYEEPTAAINIGGGLNDVKVTGYINEEAILSTKIKNYIWDLSKHEYMVFNTNNRTLAYAVPQQFLRFHIENTTDKELGVFFGTNAGETATYSTIKTEGSVYDFENPSTEIATAKLSPYTYLAPNDNQPGGCDEIDMWITITASVVTNAYCNFNFNLNIEEYIANATEESYTGEHDFVKLSSTVNASSRQSLTSTTFTSKNFKAVAIPSSVESIDGAFNGCSALEHLVIPTSVTSIQNASLAGCSALKSLSTPTFAQGVYTTNSVYELLFNTLFCTGSDTYEDENLTEIQTYTTTNTDQKIITYVPSDLNTLYFTGISIPSYSFNGYAEANYIEMEYVSSYVRFENILFGPHVTTANSGYATCHTMIFPDSVTAFRYLGEDYFMGSYCNANGVCVSGTFRTKYNGAYYNTGYNNDYYYLNWFVNRDITTFTIIEDVKYIDSALYSLTKAQSITFLSTEPESIKIENTDYFLNSRNIDKTTFKIYVPKGTLKGYKTLVGETWASCVEEVE